MLLKRLSSEAVRDSCRGIGTGESLLSDVLYTLVNYARLGFQSLILARG
jgi:hypothetical protein